MLRSTCDLEFYGLQARGMLERLVLNALLVKGISVDVESLYTPYRAVWQFGRLQSCVGLTFTTGTQM